LIQIKRTHGFPINKEAGQAACDGRVPNKVDHNRIGRPEEILAYRRPADGGRRD
jgi:hypothetical protein